MSDNNDGFPPICLCSTVFFPPIFPIIVRGGGGGGGGGRGAPPYEQTGCSSFRLVVLIRDFGLTLGVKNRTPIFLAVKVSFKGGTSRGFC